MVDIFHTERGREAAIAEAEARAGTWFSREIVAAFLEAQAGADFWDVLAGDTVEERVLELDPAVDAAEVDEVYLDEIASAFADVEDPRARSRPTTRGA